MTTLIASVSHLSRFLELTDPLKRLYLSQMKVDARNDLSKAVEWMVTHPDTPLPESAIIGSLLTPFSDYMESMEQGVIDGRSWNKAQIPGQTWLQLANENDLTITVNSLKNMQDLIAAIKPEDKGENHSGS